MEVMTLLLFVGGVWVVAGIGFFAWTLGVGTHEHADRLALLPLDEPSAVEPENDCRKVEHL